MTNDPERQKRIDDTASRIYANWARYQDGRDDSAYNAEEAYLQAAILDNTRQKMLKIGD